MNRKNKHQENYTPPKKKKGRKEENYTKAHQNQMLKTSDKKEILRAL